MKNLNSLKKLGMGLALIVSPLFASGQTTEKDSIKQVQVPEVTASNFEYHLTPEGADKGRINLFYGLPLNTKVYSFVEFYGKDGYFAKNMFFTPLIVKELGAKAFGVKELGVKIESKHSNAFSSKIGIGLEQKMKLPFGISSSVKVLPAVFNKTGYIKNEVIAGYSVSKVIPVNKKVNINLSSFGEINVACKDGPKWGYGETDASVELKTNIGQFDFGVGYNHNTNKTVGEFMPDNQFRVRVGYHPKK
jgi:hypothetical protein